jgi:hypothetical protein
MTIIEFTKKVHGNLKRNFKQYKLNKKEFGKDIAYVNLMTNLSVYIPLLNHEKWKKLNGELVEEYLLNNYSYIIDKYKNIKGDMVDKVDKKYIWVFWYQGIENAPEIVKKCVKSIRKHSGNYEVVILDKDNISNYVDIPDIILEKVNNKIFTLAFFSDILRMKLLSTYGGIWIDSTCYVSQPIFKQFDDKVFDSAKSFSNNNIKWTGFFLGGKPNKLFKYCSELLLEYACKENTLIEYFLLDYIIELAYKSISEVKIWIDAIDINSENIYLLEHNFNSIYNKEFYDNVIKAPFQKLTYKKKPRKKIFSRLTNYGYFISRKD